MGWMALVGYLIECGVDKKQERGVRYFLGMMLFMIFSIAGSQMAFAQSETDSSVVAIAHKQGFIGCDDLIKSEFKEYDASQIGRFTINSPAENHKISLSVTAAFGIHGDNIFIHDVFTMVGSICYSFRNLDIYEDYPCAQAIAQDKEKLWKFVEQLGDSTWTRNQGGIDRIFTDIGGKCVSHINVVGKSK